MSENLLVSLSDIDRHTFQVGALTKAWAGCELMIDISSAIAFGNLGGKERLSEMPRSLRKKLALIRRSLSDRIEKFPSLAHCVEIIDCTVESSDFRHLCVHGVAIYSGDGFTVQYFERFKAVINHAAKKVTGDDLNDACAQAAFLIPAWSHIVPVVCSLASIQLSPRLAVSPVQFPAPRPRPTKIEKRLIEAVEGLRRAQL